MRKRVFKLGGLLVLFALAVCVVASTAWAKPKLEVVVIGDSLSDSGNLYLLTGRAFPPPPYVERFSNGPIWAEYFIERLGLNLDDLDDRAYGGAFTGVIELPVGGLPVEFSNYNSYHYWDILSPDLPGVQEEVDSLLADHHNRLNPQALYVVWAGANDFFAALDSQTELDAILAMLAQAAQNTADTVRRLSEAGAKHFAVANLPDIGLTPFGQSQGAEKITPLVAYFNEILWKALDALPRKCAKTLVKLNAFTALQEVVAKPGDYGLVDVTTPCIVLGEGRDCSDYLFWDAVHPTTAGHALFAERFRDAFCGGSYHHHGSHGHRDGRPPAVWRRACQESNQPHGINHQGPPIWTSAGPGR
jgi:phospholipase/lecithinase/hemolysin